MSVLNPPKASIWITVRYVFYAQHWDLESCAGGEERLLKLKLSLSTKENNNSVTL